MIGLFKIVFYLFLFFVGIFFISFLIEFPSKKNASLKNDDSMLTKNEINALFDTSIYPSDTNTIQHYRCWESLMNKEYYCTPYPMKLMETKGEAKYKRIVVEDAVKSSPNYQVYWEKVYGMSYLYNPAGVSHIADSLSQIAKYNHLDKKDLANLAVSFVQDMPYWFILRNSSCLHRDYKDYPCITGVPFGLLSPMETAYAAFGDCDSKSLLIYSILRHLNFEPIIVSSNEYAHAMIALNLSSTGDFIEHRGERYYFWETTAVGWKLGMLPPSCSNPKYWEVALSFDYTNNINTQ